MIKKRKKTKKTKKKDKKEQKKRPINAKPIVLTSTYHQQRRVFPSPNFVGLFSLFRRRISFSIYFIYSGRQSKENFSFITRHFQTIHRTLFHHLSTTIYLLYLCTTIIHYVSLSTHLSVSSHTISILLY